MSTIAAAAQTADRIDYWIRRHVSQYCYGTHPSQSQSKFNPARDRRAGLLAIGNERTVRRPLDSYAPASRCTRRAARNAEIGRLTIWVGQM
jgi:hypothetical protein